MPENVQDRNYLRRGRAFLRQSTKLGLKVAPLALAAANLVHAAVIGAPTFTFSGGNATCTGDLCFVSGGAVDGTSAQAGLTGGAGIISLFTTSPVSFTVGSGGAAGSLNITWTGPVAPSFAAGQSVPYSYFFNISDTNGLDMDWALSLSGALTDSVSGTAPAGGTFVSAGSSAISTSSTTLTVNLSASFAGTPNAGDTLLVNVETPGTIDIPLSADLVTPEPATFLLLVPGMGALWMMRRRKRA